MSDGERRLWRAGDSVWLQESALSFVVESFRGMPVHPMWVGSTAAIMAGATSDGAGNYFPVNFKFSPKSGLKAGPLKELPARFCTSLPPFAQTDGDRCGFAYTSNSLQLEIIDEATVPLAPNMRIPLPPNGRHQFLVGNFGLARPVLLSFDLASGSLSCWLAHKQVWAELAMQGGIYLAGFSEQDLSWNLHARDAKLSGTLYVPTDAGFAAVVVNPLALTCTVEYVNRLACIAGVVECRGDIFSLINDHGTVKVLQCTPDTAGERHSVVVHEVRDLPKNWSHGRIRLPYTRGREICWLCDGGQVRVTLGVDGKFVISATMWPLGTSPCFEFGGPYQHADGSVWQQCFDSSGDDTDEHGYCFVQVGRTAPERKRVGSYRMMGGRTSLHRDQRLIGVPPWDSPATDGGGLRRIVVPIVESVTGSQPMLCFSAPFRGDPKAFFESTDSVDVEYLLWGHVRTAPNHTVSFSSDRAATPWDARAVIFDDHMFIYDPDSAQDLRGWKLNGK